VAEKRNENERCGNAYKVSILKYKITLYSRMVTVFTAKLNVKKFYIPATKRTSMIFMVLRKKTATFPYVTLTDWALYPRKNAFTVQYGLNSYI
jgi:hypothetical protein